MSEETLITLQEKIEKSVESLRSELNTVRAGRANPALLDKVTVDYYGTQTPLKQLANISCPDPRTIMVIPFDPKSAGNIEHAILAANVGINPVNDGKGIRLSVPQVTEERRKELTKEVRKMGEAGKVSIRNLRKKANEDIKKQEKAGELTEDDRKSEEAEVQKAVDEGIKKVDEVIAAKEKEIMEV